MLASIQRLKVVQLWVIGKAGMQQSLWVYNQLGVL